MDDKTSKAGQAEERSGEPADLQRRNEEEPDVEGHLAYRGPEKVADPSKVADKTA